MKHLPLRRKPHRSGGRPFILAVLLLLMASFAFGSNLAPVPAPGAFNTRFIEEPGIREFSGRLIARPLQMDALMNLGMSADEAMALRVNARAEIEENYDVIHYVEQTDEFIFEVPAGLTENEVARELMRKGYYQYVEPDWTVFPVGCPNDPQFGNQWHHQSNRMNSCAGWNIDTGNPSVGVGICDTGVRTTHEDLLLHRLEGYNAVDRLWESQGGQIDPVHPHGTMTTGCAAANGNNGVGVSGVGWDLSHRMLRVTNSPSGNAYLSDLQHAARTSIESGDRVASVSYSGADASSNLTTATYIKSIGGLLVWAAGNDGRYLNFGNRDNDDIIVVGATDQNDQSAWFSAYGPYVDLVAPGVGILTTDSQNNSSYSAVDGTSFSTPLTAGLIGLIWSADPTLTPDEVENILKQGCDDLGSGGVDNTFGYGRINVYGSLSLVGGGGGGGNPPVADFVGSPTSGTAPLTVSFTDLSTGNPTSWSWDFGDGGTSTQQNPTYTYTGQGTYTVSLTVSNADGSDTKIRSNYISVSSGGGYSGEGYILSRNPDFSTDDRTFTRSDVIYMLVWSDQVDYTNMRKAEWELRDANKNKVKQNLTNNWDGSFTASFDLSQLPSNATDWTWKGKLEDQNRVKYNPTTNITVLAGGGNPPVADFVGSPTSGTAPLTVSFTDLSTGNPTSWSWDFGDGGTSTQQNPTYTYTGQGTYTVSLTVSNADGSDTKIRSNYISVSSGGGYSGEGYILSRNPDFSTDDRTFTRSDVIYMLVWSDQVDYTNMRKAEWELRDANKNKVKQNLTNNWDGSFTASFDLSQLPSNATDWTWKGKLEDQNRVKYRPSTNITVLP